MIFRSKKSKLTLLIIPLLVFSFIFSGCSVIRHPKKYFNSDFNLGGAITHKNGDFTPVETGSIRLESSEIMNRQHFSGSKTTFFWGLFSFTDY
jgi:hypothetical protein